MMKTSRGFWMSVLRFGMAYVNQRGYPTISDGFATDRGHIAADFKVVGRDAQNA
jgi:hypothetical protein